MSKKIKNIIWAVLKSEYLWMLLIFIGVEILGPYVVDYLVDDELIRAAWKIRIGVTNIIFLAFCMGAARAAGIARRVMMLALAEEWQAVIDAVSKANEKEER